MFIALPVSYEHTQNPFSSEEFDMFSVLHLHTCHNFLYGTNNVAPVCFTSLIVYLVDRDVMHLRLSKQALP